jgi:Protein of unknown function (DUF5661)
MYLSIQFLNVLNIVMPRGSKSRAKVKRAKTKSKSTNKRKTASKARVTKTTKTRSKSKTRTMRKKRVTLQEVKKIGAKLKVDFTVLEPKTLQSGMNIELEHGYIDPRTNVTNNDLTLTAKIALAHIVEFPDYYARLKQMEEVGKKYWKNRKKSNIFKK